VSDIVKEYVVELAWDGAPPVEQRLRQLARRLVRIEPSYLTIDGREIEERDLTTQGIRFMWRKPLLSLTAFALLFGEDHPVKVRWAPYQWSEAGYGPDGYDAWQALETTPWTYSRSLGAVDAGGRLLGAP
jgi:hypothetical protein